MVDAHVVLASAKENRYALRCVLDQLGMLVEQI